MPVRQLPVIRFSHPFVMSLLCAICLAAPLSYAATPQPGYPVPQIIGPTHPSAVLPGSLHFTLEVYGANFINGSMVNWNGSARTTTFLSAHHLRAQINAADVAADTSGFITVMTNSPNGPIKSSSYAQVLVHQPTTNFNAERASTELGVAGPFMLGDTTGTNRVDITGITNEGFQTLLNKGDGTFAYAPNFITRYPGFGGADMGDFNGDGHMDFVYVGTTTNQSLFAQRVAVGGPGATYTKGATNGVYSFTPNNFVIGDFNRDGILDIYTGVGGGNQHGADQAFLGNGDATFRKGSYAGAEVGRTLLIDVNNDGILDLVALDSVSGANLYVIHVYVGNGDGTFQKAKTVEQNIDAPLVPVFCSSDFNGDGNTDLLYPDANGQLHVLLGNGDGTFRTAKLTSFDSQTNLVLGDFNSDGKVDVLSVGIISTTLLAGNGDGTFTTLPSVDIPHLLTGGPNSAADFNGDGLLDLVAGSTPTGAYTIFFQQ